jgi:mRNA-degrading endonuclease RelE of RelBE toxin-antitoxin system
VLPSERRTVSHKETPVASFPPENLITAFIQPENLVTIEDARRVRPDVPRKTRNKQARRYRRGNYRTSRVKVVPHGPGGRPI